MRLFQHVRATRVCYCGGICHVACIHCKGRVQETDKLMFYSLIRELSVSGKVILHKIWTHAHQKGAPFCHMEMCWTDLGWALPVIRLKNKCCCKKTLLFYWTRRYFWLSNISQYFGVGDRRFYVNGFYLKRLANHVMRYAPDHKICFIW